MIRPYRLLLLLFIVTLASDDRRRLKVLYWGATIAMGPRFSSSGTRCLCCAKVSDTDALAYSMLAMALFPVTMAYAIVAHRIHRIGKAAQGAESVGR